MKGVADGQLDVLHELLGIGGDLGKCRTVDADRPELLRDSFQLGIREVGVHRHSIAVGNERMDVLASEKIE